MYFGFCTFPWAFLRRALQPRARASALTALVVARTRAAFEWSTYLCASRPTANSKRLHDRRLPQKTLSDGQQSLPRFPARTRR